MPEKRKHKKVVRNKIRDGIGDYYKTNRQISQENAKEQKNKQWNRREKTMVVMVVLLLICLIIKSLVLDGVKNLSPDEQKFKDFVEYSVSEQYDGFLENSGILIYRVYGIDVADKDQKSILRYKEPSTGEMVELTQGVQYSAKVRGYLFWVLPVKHIIVTAETQ